MTNQCKFKEGDKVKRINGETFSNGEFVVTVEGMGIKSKEVWLKETQSWLHENDLCLANSFTKSDLKDGMVVTYRDKTERIVFDRKLYSTAGENYNFLRQLSLDYFYDDLSCDHRSYDIMKVTYMDEVLWEREEESEEDKKIKEFTNWFYKIAEEHRLYGLSFDMDKVRSIKEELNKLL